MLRNKLTFTTLFAFALTSLIAQTPPPPFEDDGGGGTTGTGGYPSSHIDQFLYILFVIAVAVIFYVQHKMAQKQRKKRYTTTARQIEKHREPTIQKADLNKI